VWEVWEREMEKEKGKRRRRWCYSRRHDLRRKTKVMSTTLKMPKLTLQKKNK
jgi:hypothetical protein